MFKFLSLFKAKMVLIAAILAVFFVLDISMPLGFAAGVPYVLAYLVLQKMDHKEYKPHFTLVLTVICLLLTLVGYFTSDPGNSDPVMAIMNRVLSMMVILVGYKGVTTEKKFINQLYLANKAIEHSKKNLEDEVVERTAELRTALENEKVVNELKSRFVTMASHEFRTPVATILSSNILLDKYREKGDFDKQKKHVGRIQTSCKHILGLLDDFLLLDALEKDEMDKTVETVDVFSEIKERIPHYLSEADDRNIRFFHTGEIDIVFNRQVFSGVLDHLLSNALKFSEKEIIVRTNVTERKLLLEVQDFGIGIPEDEQKLMFSKFFRAVNVTNIEGTGLGLNIIQRYLKHWHGEITFESKVGEGTTMKVEIDLSEFQDESLEVNYLQASC